MLNLYNSHNNRDNTNPCIDFVLSIMNYYVVCRVVTLYRIEFNDSFVANKKGGGGGGVCVEETKRNKNN